MLARPARELKRCCVGLYKYVPELKPDSQHPELTGSTAPQWGIAG